MGHDVDVYLNAPSADAFVPLISSCDWAMRVYTDRSFRVDEYDFGMSLYGRRQLLRMFPPGLCLKVEKRHARKQSETEANMECARALGYSGPTPRASLTTAGAKADVPEGAVVVHAGCDPSALVKRWPHWRDVCERLRDAGRHVIVVGTSSDRSDEGWETRFDARFDLKLTNLLAVLSGADVYLGNDSGVGHMAASTGMRGLLLFGPSDPIKNAPNSTVMRVMAAEAEDGEERDVNAKRPVPVDRLTLDQVWGQIDEILANPKRDPERILPDRLTDDSPELRWDRYTDMTRQQAPRPVLFDSGAIEPAPKVSVVIPTYNRADNVWRCVESALNQTFQDIEVLVVDDGSSDETLDRFTPAPDRVRFIRQENAGASAARNTALRMARGEWIALLDSDDEWAKDKLEKQFDACGSSYVACATQHWHINRDGSKQIKPERLPGVDHAPIVDLYRNLSLKTSSLLFRRHLLDKVGLFNERYPISNDWDFFLRLARAVGHAGFTMVAEPLVTVHRSDDSLSKSNRTRALHEALTRIQMVNALLMNHDPATTKKLILRAGKKHIELARAWRKQGDIDKARHHAKEAIRSGHRAPGIWRWLRALKG